MITKISAMTSVNNVYSNNNAIKKAPAFKGQTQIVCKEISEYPKLLQKVKDFCHEIGEYFGRGMQIEETNKSNIITLKYPKHLDDFVEPRVIHLGNRAIDVTSKRDPLEAGLSHVHSIQPGHHYPDMVT